MLNAQQITEHVLRERLAPTAHIDYVTRNYHLAEDVYREICVKAISQTDKFSSKEHLMNWFRVSDDERQLYFDLYVGTYSDHIHALVDESAIR